jgi:hypothetical protein
MVHCPQAVYTGNKAGDDLFLAVSEIKASVRRGLTLVDVYGSYSTLAKVATLVMRKNINAKYDKVGGLANEHLCTFLVVAVQDSSMTGRR